jgi:sigma-B regulation protein RsbU (phosphoserine phosphatase)
MRRPVTIRRSLLVNLIVVVALLSAAFYAVTVLAGRRAVRELSTSLIGQTIDLTEARLGEFFRPIIRSLSIACSWGEAGLLDIDRPEQLTAEFVPLMREFPQISGIMIADDRGRELMVLREGKRWRVRRVRRDEWGDRAEWLEWTDDNPAPVASQTTTTYDPRERPWFEGAVERERAGGRAAGATPDQRIHWTDPYTFFTTQDPGITASIAFEPAGGEPGRADVIGFDIRLNDITDFTAGLRPSPDGFAFVITVVGQLIGLPRQDMFTSPIDRGDAILKRPDQINAPVIKAGTDAYFRQPEASRGAYRFRSGGRAWWAGARPYRLGPDQALLMAVGVPESDLVGGIARIRLWVLLAAIIVLAGGIWRAVVLARRYSAPIERLVAESERMSRGDLEPGQPVTSSVKELRRLAEAQDRMRLGLKALMKLERDLQLARQIQERTFPDRLPRLRGFALDAWSEPADETGGDTYDVVGYQTAPAGTPIVLSVERAEQAVLLMADATGHGIGPALSVAQVRAMLRMAVRSGETLPSIVRNLNDQLCADLPEGRFITAWLGWLKGADRTLQSFSAGQAPILRYVRKRDAFEVADADTVPLGVVEDLEFEVPEPVAMRAGDIVAVISDGIFEATDPSGEQFGKDRVMEVIRANRDRSPGTIIKAVREAVERFTAGMPAADDRTGIIIKGA